jgi:transposase
MHWGRTMGKHNEVFVAFYVAKKKHAVAIAEGGRSGEVRFLGDVENTPRIERTIGRLADRYDRLQVCFEAGPMDTGFIARSRRSATTVWWSLRPYFRNLRASASRRTGATRSRWRDCNRPAS